MKEESLMAMAYRVRGGDVDDIDRSNLANSSIYLNALMLNYYGEAIEVADQFERLWGDGVMNPHGDCDGGDCVNEILFRLQDMGYVSEGRYPRITQRGIEYLRKTLEITLDDSARTGDYAEILYQSAAVLYKYLSKLNLKPTIAVPFPLIGSGVFYMKKESTGVWHRYIIPDILIRLDALYIPLELGLTKYTAIEIQLSNYQRLAGKEEKYIRYNGSDFADHQLFPLYLLENNRIRNEEEGRKLIEKAGRQISKALPSFPGRDDRLFYNIAYYFRSGRLIWLFPPDRGVKPDGQ